MRRMDARPATNKTMTLQEAVTRLVRPGDALHLGATHVRGAAAPWEVLRQFHGTTPGFELQGVSMTTAIAPLVHAGLVDRIVTSWSGDGYYTPGPSPIFQKAHARGVRFEHWTILTLPQRLAAAARGHEWTPTRSIIGSQMEIDNADDIRILEPGLALMRSLTPDVSFFHAPVADEAGNVAMTPPMLENVWGALAARRGAIVTVEKIVDAAYIRQHAHLVRIPSHVVAAVVELPFGAHPGGVFPRGLSGVTGYGEDYPFWASMRSALRDDDSCDAWIREWILDPPDRAAYLSKLGQDHLQTLVAQADPDRVPTHVQDALKTLDLHAPANNIERGIVAGARLLAERAEQGGLTHMLAGAGMANLAAWLAAASLRAKEIPVELVAEMGLIGYQPQEGEPFIFNHRNFWSATMLTDIEMTMGVVMGGSKARSIASLGGAIVDKRGNINTTISGGKLLMGSGGANDVATCATEAVITTIQHPKRMVDHVEYVTSPGARVVAMATTHGTYTKHDDELILTGVWCDDDTDQEQAVKMARAQCGWDLKVARDVVILDPPRPDELTLLRRLDPNGYFRGSTA